MAPAWEGRLSSPRSTSSMRPQMAGCEHLLQLLHQSGAEPGIGEGLGLAGRTGEGRRHHQVAHGGQQPGLIAPAEVAHHRLEVSAIGGQTPLGGR